MVDMTIKGSVLKMEIDTEAAVPIIFQASYISESVFRGVTEYSIPLCLITEQYVWIQYTFVSEHIQVVDEMITQEHQAKELGLIVVQGKSSSLFGHS